MNATGRPEESQLRHAITTLHTQPVWQLTDAELNQRLTTLAVAWHHLGTLIGCIALEADTRDTMTHLGYPRAAALIANTAPLSLGQAHQVTKRGKRIETLDRSDEAYTPVTDAHARGEIPSPHADLIAGFLVKYNKLLPDEAKQAVVAALLGYAADPDTKQLRDALVTFRESLERDHDKRDPGEDRDLDSLHLSPLLSGRYKLDAELNKICADSLDYRGQCVYAGVMRLNREQLIALVAIVYARVSKDDSRKARSVAEQIEGTRADLADEGVSVGAGAGGVELVFADNDIGASRHTRRKARPDFDRMRSQIRRGRVLAVWEPSRLSRNTTEFMLLLDACAGAGVPIFYGGTFYDMNDSDDRYRVEQDALDGAREAGRTRKRVLRSVTANAAAGNPHGRPPFGYEIVWEQGRAVARRPHPTEAGYVVAMVQRLLDGETYYKIAKWLTAQEVPVPGHDDALACRRRDCRGAPQRDGRGPDRRECGCPTDWATRWTTSMVKGTVGRATYAGLREHRRAGELMGVAEGSWPALIGVADHERVKQINAAARPAPRGNKPKHLLSGLMMCGQCGHPMYYRGPRRDTPARYKCGVNHCTSRLAQPLQEWVEANIVARLESEDLRTLLETSDADAAVAHAEARELRIEFNTWISAALAAKLPPADIAAYRELHEPDVIAAEALAAARLPHKHLADAAGPDARRRWQTEWSLEHKRDIIASMVSIRVNRHVRAKGVFGRTGIDPSTIDIRRLF